jgi:hypothetical protein
MVVGLLIQYYGFLAKLFSKSEAIVGTSYSSTHASLRSFGLSTCVAFALVSLPYVPRTTNLLQHTPVIPLPGLRTERAQTLGLIFTGLRLFLVSTQLAMILWLGFPRGANRFGLPWSWISGRNDAHNLVSEPAEQSTLQRLGCKIRR